MASVSHVGMNTVALNDFFLQHASEKDPGFAALNADAHAATDHEHRMTFLQAIKLYPKAVGWSVVLSTAIVMEGYDVVLLANFFALDSFNKRYGTLGPDGEYTISAPWKSGLTNGASVGEILGLYAAGVVQQKIGYRKTMIGALAMITCTIFLTFFAQSLPMLLVGEILCGIPWGVFQTMTTAYASDVCPVALRAYLTTYVNLCWVFGQLIGSGVLRAMLERNDQWGYRIPFALQWMWPLPILIGCIFAPESPYWLVQKGKIADAKHALRRLTTKSDPTFDADKTIAMMQHTNEIEKEVTAGTTYWDCFKGVNLRRTEIACVTWLVQQFCGSTFMGYSTVFYEAAGLDDVYAFDLSMAQYGLGAIGTMGSWWLMGYAGRRTLYMYGTAILFILLMVIGFVSLAPRSNNGANWAIGSLLLIFTFTYDLTVGPVCYSLVAEIPSTRLKSQTVILARNFYNIGGIVTNIVTNYMLTATAWNWGAHSGFFWAGTCLLCVIWIFFRLPEPKGRTYGELDVLFERKVPARNFKSTEVDIFRSDNLALVETERRSSSPSDVYDEKVTTKHIEA